MTMISKPLNAEMAPFSELLRSFGGAAPDPERQQPGPITDRSPLIRG